MDVRQRDLKQDYLICLAGPSGTGKSSIVALVSLLFQGVCSFVAPGIIVGREQVTPATASAIAGSRIATSIDLTFSETIGISLANMKVLTGGDAIGNVNGEPTKLLSYTYLL